MQQSSLDFIRVILFLWDLRVCKAISKSQGYWQIGENRMGIDKQFTIIRQKGRLAFLVSSPDNFIGILHDYSDKSKGFVFWKTALEEKLI